MEIKRIYLFITITFNFSLLTFSLLFPSRVLAAPLLHTHYYYDNTGNINKIEDKVDTTKTIDYVYDGVYRLESATGGYTANYSYDIDGNIGTKKEGNESLSISYDGPGPVHGPKTVNGKTLVYDENGNLKEDSYSDLSITYDYENRPIEIKKKSTGVTLAKYFYDGQGKRVKKEVYEDGEIKTTTYYVSSLYEKEVPKTGDTKIRKFYAGIAYREGDTLTYTTTNQQSSTTLTTNNQGQNVAEYRYYPYGSPVTPSSPLPPNSWIGQKLDTESNLYFLNARYYNSFYGRFVNSDTVEDPSARGNRFIYSANNPISLADPGGACIGTVVDEAGNPLDCEDTVLDETGKMMASSIEGMWDWINLPIYLRDSDYGSAFWAALGIIPGGNTKGMLTAQGKAAAIPTAKQVLDWAMAFGDEIAYSQVGRLMKSASRYQKQGDLQTAWSQAGRAYEEMAREGLLFRKVSDYNSVSPNNLMGIRNIAGKATMVIHEKAWNNLDELIEHGFHEYGAWKNEIGVSGGRNSPYWGLPFHIADWKIGFGSESRWRNTFQQTLQQLGVK